MKQFNVKVPARPICDVCNEPVERITYTKSHRDYSLKIVAHCHGEHEAVSVPQEVFQSVGSEDSIVFDRAFKKQKMIEE